MPIEWDEVDDPKLTSQRYTMKDALKRLEKDGDVWKGWRRRAKSLKQARKKLDKLIEA